MTAILDPWQPSAADPFDLRKAGHLVRRAACGASLGERERMVRMGVERAVDRVLEAGPGEDVDALFEDVLALGDVDKLRAYRVWRLLAGRQRLRETMSLFWHGHFATSIEKVGSVRMMGRQLALFDRLGTGRFDDLLLEVSRDPAMIRWLDNDTNVKGQANENYARELFELFALGRGHYSERDVAEAARAFTGWHLRGERFQFVRRKHDDGPKTVLGRSGAFGGEEIVAMAVAHEASARFVAGKMLQHFVHPEPTTEEVDALAAEYAARDRDLGATIEVLLRSRLFFGPRAYRTRVKSPVDFVVGLVRTCGASAAPEALGKGIARLGQVLLAPPGVEGWHGERAWLTSATWLLRSNLAAAAFGGRRGLGMTPNPCSQLDGLDNDERVEIGVRMLLDGDVSSRGRARIAEFADSRAARGPGGDGALLHAIFSLPEAQLL